MKLLELYEKWSHAIEEWLIATLNRCTPDPPPSGLIRRLVDIFGLPPAEAADIVRAGLVGEYGFLRPFGIVVTEAAVMAKTNDPEHLTEGDKVKIRYALMSQQLDMLEGRDT